MAEESYEAVVIGGGPAGLQAALTLGRVHVTTLVLDSGSYRNARSSRMHDVLGHDGVDPSAFRTAARTEVAGYGVEVRDAAANQIDAVAEGFSVAVSGERIRADRLILATGVRDQMPPIPGMAELWGELVLVCPYCHGHEFAGRPIVVLAEGDGAAHLAGLLDRIGSTVRVIAPEEALAVRRTDRGVRIERRSGGPIEAACVFVRSAARVAAPFAEQLGLEATSAGVAVDARYRTNRRGVWAVGDAAARADPHIPAAVITAMASGLIAGADCAASLSAPAGSSPGPP